MGWQHFHSKMQVFVVFAFLPLVWGNPENLNPMRNKGMFEGDIAGIDPFADRNAIPRDSQRWPGGVVPYIIDSSVYYDKFLEPIKKAMAHISEKTCITFVERTHQKDYVRIFKGSGCWSYWGRLGIGEQKLSLKDGCEPFGTVVHELMHAIGFEHEHSRSDRDDYLNIHWENIPDNEKHNFKKFLPHENRLLTTFDYDSIMLYGDTGYEPHYDLLSMTAKDGRKLIEVYDKPGMSPIDVKRVKMLYCS
ncbi:astacin-like metalloprotease toxin 5 [Uloborus diversus]|uniref:astacin-like metalloprotease toxin 5 n=1 Tax=Uloborus diversus TaxID=327109 RepID=UPI0024092574|nr:astacin-like metalloprotease toxin 5 [Uloborus diversus]